LASLAALIRVAPAQALARAHALVARGVVPDSDLGKIGSEPAMAARMNSLAELLTRQTSAPAIVVGAIAHAELAVVAPFAEASGMIARAAEHLVLIAAGLDPYGVIVVEAGHAESGSTYAAGLDAYADGSVDGVKSWLMQCAAAVTRGAELSPVGLGLS
jgi:Fic family protein